MSKTLFLTFLFFNFLSYYVDAKCEHITNDLRTDGNWNFDDTFYSFSGGNITFTLTDMPCGASLLLIQVVSQNGGNNFDVRNFTIKDLNVHKNIGVNVITDKQHLFRIQANVGDFKNISCPNPRFSGELCYSRYVDPPDCEKEKTAAINNCKNEKIIAITVPIASAIIGALGGIAIVLIKQHIDDKSNKSDSTKP
ncbi:hypothetical protein RclHR1_01450002 [Rhizophagus clarus]|uniref:Autophagy-related protein 27 n=1 Tax=Rhizophagus clarus TaxID=94130 RepID=A0A2Z6QS85_9GLOM|nr:hypothetical protein RclHR1_01450002 [Rhizophagus clarus]